MLGSRRAALSEPDAVRAAASGMAGSVSPALLGILQTTARLPGSSHAGAAGAVARAIRRIIFYRDGLRGRKRVVSYGPRSTAGAQVWDAMETLLSTARKLGVNFFQYIRDRVSGARQMPALAELIKERAETMDPSFSWTPT